MSRSLDLVDEPMQVDIPGGMGPEENNGSGENSLNFIVSDPKLDLDAYISNYKGITKLQRLMFIAKHCPSFAVDALRTAASIVKTTSNVYLYKEIISELSDAISKEGGQQAAPPGQQPEIDNHWVETTLKKADHKTERLDQELKTYKNNSIKESIRRGHDDLGDHFLDMGDFNNALKCYTRSRDYCICAQHIFLMCINVINVSIYMDNWPHVQNYVQKAESVPDIFEVSSSQTNLSEKQKKFNSTAVAKLKCASGLSELSQKHYKNAARVFLEVSLDHLDYNEVISSQDVAIYGGICALATFDREELHRKVLSSSSFKQFLELQPQLRDILQKFYASKYAICLDLLQKMKENLLLDIYLSPHVDRLYTQIRNRALIQYFSPYVSADLNKMAESFNTTVNLLEDELTQLILDGQISARIDSHKKVLHARDVDLRCATFEKALDIGKEYERRTRALIIRTLVVQNRIHVKAMSGREEDAMSR